MSIEQDILVIKRALQRLNPKFYESDGSWSALSHIQRQDFIRNEELGRLRRELDTARARYFETIAEVERLREERDAFKQVADRYLGEELRQAEIIANTWEDEVARLRQVLKDIIDMGPHAEELEDAQTLARAVLEKK